MILNGWKEGIHPFWSVLSLSRLNTRESNKQGIEYTSKDSFQEWNHRTQGADSPSTKRLEPLPSSHPRSICADAEQKRKRESTMEEKTNGHINHEI